MSHSLSHAFFATLIYTLYSFIAYIFGQSQITFLNPSWIFFFYFIIGSIIFDIDHAFYYLLTTKPRHFSLIRERIAHDYEFNVPHLYFAHSIEFLLFLGVFTMIFRSPLLFWLLLGWFVHILQDIWVYHQYEKSQNNKPSGSLSLENEQDPRLWRVYFSLIWLCWKHAKN